LSNFGASDGSSADDCRAIIRNLKLEMRRNDERY